MELKLEWRYNIIAEEELSSIFKYITGLDKNLIIQLLLIDKDNHNKVNAYIDYDGCVIF